MNRFASVPREILYFAGVGGYGFGSGIVYWLLTHEAAGSILLTVFGWGALTFGLFLALSIRGDRARSADSAAGDGTEGPFGSPTGRVPVTSLAPLEVGFGLAVVSLSLAFGPWLAVAGIVPVVAGAAGWIRDAERELRATQQAEIAVSRPRPSAEPPSA